MEQAGSGCATISALNPAPFAVAGGKQTIALNNAAECAFTPIPLDTWLTVTSPNPLQGNPSVDATAAANNAATPRTTSVYLGRFRLPVLQQGTQFTTVFGDVNQGTAFAGYINALEKSGLADLCATGFCPGAATTRAQMAEYLVHSLYRSGDFTIASAPYFTDVSSSHPRFRWIQKLFELGVTTGCGGGRFCPEDSVTRGQMATFLVRARAGINSNAAFPFRSAAYFTDVPAGHQFSFCPDDVVSRGQMSVFLVRGFLTP